MNALSRELFDGFSWNLKCRCNKRSWYSLNIIRIIILQNLRWWPFFILIMASWLIKKVCVCALAQTAWQIFMKLAIYVEYGVLINWLDLQKNWFGKFKMAGIYKILKFWFSDYLLQFSKSQHQWLLEISLCVKYVN